MDTKSKPKLLTHWFLEGRVIGAIMQDADGYFYRPKRSSSIGHGPHTSKWDGAHFPTHKQVTDTLDANYEAPQ